MPESDESAVTTIILAAGQGTRMRSKLSKVLHPLMGKPLICHSIETASAASTTQPVVVVSPQAEDIRAAVGAKARFVVQARQLGTAHAVAAAEELIREEVELVLIIFGDMPLLRVETLHKLVEMQRDNPGPISMATVVLEDSHGFGRVLRDDYGRISGIVEEAVATPDQLKIKELNASAYCVRAGWFWPALHRIGLSPKGEYYLTDMVELAVQEGLEVRGLIMADKNEALGINNRVHLAEAEGVLRNRINEKWMLSGVTMIDPEHTYIDAGVSIEPDTTIYPNTYLQGMTRVESGCRIGPNTTIRNSTVGKNCTIPYGYLEGAKVLPDTHLRPFEIVVEDEAVISNE